MASDYSKTTRKPDRLSRPFLETVVERMKNDPEFAAAMEEAESPCSVCGRVILCGGCPSKHPECPCYQGHKR